MVCKALNSGIDFKPKYIGLENPCPFHYPRLTCRPTLGLEIVLL